MLGRDYPALRRSYLKFPWPRLYEHPHNIATLNIERRLPDEDIVLYCLIRGPENRSLAELDALVRHHQEAPIETLRSYRRAVAVSRIPWNVRDGLSATVQSEVSGLSNNISSGVSRPVVTSMQSTLADVHDFVQGEVADGIIAVRTR